MTETGEMLATAAKRLFEESFTDAAVRAAANGIWQADAWSAVEAGGYPLALVSEEQGGFGLEQSEALNLIRVAAYYAAPVPLSETMLANHALTSSGFAAVEGPATVAPVLERDTLQLQRESGHWRLNGVAHAVPWARHASHIVGYAEHAGEMFVMPLTRADFVVSAGSNMAGQPRDTVEFNATLSDEVVRPITGPGARTRRLGRGAVLRALEMAGALDRVLKMTTDYATERVQFGKPIGRFQAVQHLIAVLATQVAAAGAAADIAGASFQQCALLAIAAAKLRAGEAAGICASIAHQVHGAIGYADEHRLNYFTKRLWSWRDEFGSETSWGQYLGRCALDANADGFWPFVVDVFNPSSASQP